MTDDIPEEFVGIDPTQPLTAEQGKIAFEWLSRQSIRGTPGAISVSMPGGPYKYLVHSFRRSMAQYESGDPASIAMRSFLGAAENLKKTSQLARETAFAHPKGDQFIDGEDEIVRTWFEISPLVQALSKALDSGPDRLSPLLAALKERFDTFRDFETSANLADRNDADRTLLTCSALQPNEMKVLEALKDRKSTIVISDLAEAVDLSARTLSPVLGSLKKSGLIGNPHGKKKGVAITSMGRSILGSS